MVVFKLLKASAVKIKTKFLSAPTTQANESKRNPKKPAKIKDIDCFNIYRSGSSLLFGKKKTTVQKTKLLSEQIFAKDTLQLCDGLSYQGRVTAIQKGEYNSFYQLFF
jgi:hypothetical protein